MRKHFLTASLAGWLLSGCESATSVSPAQGPEGSWALQSLARADGSSTQVASPERYTIRFTPEGVANVRADCNLCNGSYQAVAPSLTIGLLACTRAYCGPASLDNEYTSAISSASSFERRGTTLVVRYPGGTLTFLAAP